MKITTSGIDVAKSVFQVHGVDARGNVVVRRQIRRSQLLLFFSKLEPCLIGMEACATSHYWARKLSALGHTIRLMAPQFVKPYRKNDKNDGNDAEAICEALQRPSMRFVSVKSPEQQAELAVHRIRQRLMGERTALINQLRGLLAEFGLVLAQGANQVRSQLPPLLDNSGQSLPPLAVELFRDLYEELRQLEQRIAEHDRRIERLYRGNVVSRKLGEIEGIGSLTATAFTATVAHAAQFKNGRQCAAWLGLTPGRIPAEERTGSWASPSAGTCTCARCSCTEPARSCATPRRKTIRRAAGSSNYAGDAATTLPLARSPPSTRASSGRLWSDKRLRALKSQTVYNAARHT
jgi:transposase